MASPLPPDPYAALGVAKDATAAAIKTAYRKLALKSHPDKFPDTEKAQKADEFHRIQQAYEILADTDRRERYNAQVRLAELRREALERGMRSSEPAKDSPRAAAYDVRTPRGAYSARETKTSSRPEPKTRAAYDSDERHYDDARARPPRRATKVSFSYSRGPSPDRRRERIRVFSFGASSTKYERSQNSKTRSQEKKRGTEDKFSRVNEDAEDSDRYEDRRRWHRSEAQRYEEDERRREEDEYKRLAEAERRAAEAERHRDEQRRREGPPRRSSKMHRDDSYTSKVEEAMEYIRSSRTTPRGGTSSSDDARPSKRSYEKVRPSVSRRTSEKLQKDRILAGMRHGSAHREKMPEIYERRSSPEDPRRRPPLEKADTMPSKYSSAKVNLERSATIDSYDRRDAPRPVRRSETLPTKSNDYAYERPAANSSKPRDMPMDSGYSSPSTPSTPTPPEREQWHTKSHSYHYSDDGGVSLGDNTGYHTVVVEPTDDDATPRRRSSSSQERMRSSREEDRPTPTSTRASRRPAAHTHHRSFAADPDPPRESHRRGRPTAGASSRHMSSAGPIPMTQSPEREYPEQQQQQQRESRGRDRDRDRDRDRAAPAAAAAASSLVDPLYYDSAAAAEHKQHHQHPHHRRGSLWETSPPPISKQAGRPAAAPSPTSRGATRADVAGYTLDDVIFGPRLRSGFSSSTANAAAPPAAAGKRGQIPRPGPITHPSVHHHMSYTAGEAKARMGERFSERLGERERDAYPFPDVHIPRPPLVKRTTVN
ncbi:hypothetical protein BKA81DRAFT_377370 [Phyllosticta paracitricarpa]|uniref:J domain-containing protein n=1 Tax=Phyllosticta paracitricarpa TaxID=2016321 RepID=A0ABR1NIH0_9PEZI